MKWLPIASALSFAIPAGVFSDALSVQRENASIVGRWDLVVEGREGPYPSWLEVVRSGRTSLVGRFVGQTGSSRPVGQVERMGDGFRFSIPPQWEVRSGNAPLVFEGRLEGGRLVGTTTGNDGSLLAWEGQPAPDLERTRPAKWGAWRPLFDGRSLEGWKTRWSNRPNGWVVQNGALSNARPGNDLLTTENFEDFKIRIEFRYPKGSNSGIYLRGRYEVQIEDNAGRKPSSHGIGGVYGFLEPRTNPAKPAGEWQAMEITLEGRRVTVKFNGATVLDWVEIPGITGGALDSREGEPGPVLIQGDHGPIEFRKIEIAVPEK